MLVEVGSEKVKTLLIEDSGLMRILVSDLLRGADDIELVGTAKNGKEGAEKINFLNPDVVVTDMVMPDYDGLYLIKNVMAKNPKPIIVLSTLEKTDGKIFDALEAGAFAFADKPIKNGETDEDLAKDNLIRLIKSAMDSNHKALLSTSTIQNNHVHSFNERLNYEIIVIGASTGGPGAVESIVRKLPANLSIPVVIAQHMPSRFIRSFVERLNQHVPLHVRVAKNNESPEGGNIYVAPGEKNLKLMKSSSGQPVFAYTSKMFEEFNHPSVDCLFESTAQVFKEKTLAVLLTGMGKDGGKGMKEIKENGGYNIAQDESSSVIYGMPKYAAQLGVVDATVNLKEIPGFLISCL